MSLIKAKMSVQRQLRIRKDCVRAIVPIKGFSSCFFLVRDNSEDDKGDFELEEPFTYKTGCSFKSMYKYVDFEGFLKTLKTGFLFKEPSLWTDPYESLFYNAKYYDIDNHLTPNPMYAGCFTIGEETEASWKQYTGNSGLKARCVRIKLDFIKLISILDKYAEKHQCKVYIGAVTYRITEQDIKLLLEEGTKLNSFWMTKFSLNTYLSLMLIKRPAYYNEKEVRVLVVPKNGNLGDTEGKIFLETCTKWGDLVKEVKLEPNCTDEELKFLEWECNQNGISCPVIKSTLNERHPDIGIRPVKSKDSFIADIYDML